MKRASLKTAKVPVTATTAPDVTDRILKADLAVAPVPSPKRPTPAKRRPRPTPSNVTTAEHPITSQDAPGALDLALTQTRLALEALQQARAEAPAQYDLGVRYRLDALAHHLQQVADFMTRSIA